MNVKEAKDKMDVSEENEDVDVQGQDELNEGTDTNKRKKSQITSEQNKKHKSEICCPLCQEFGHVWTEDCLVNATCFSCGIKGHVQWNCGTGTSEFAITEIRHIESIHGNVSYACDQRKYKATRKAHLKQHIESVHANDTYSCDTCQYKATHKPNLKTHIESIHENVTYACDQCEYKPTQMSSLKRQIKSLHIGRCRQWGGEGDYPEDWQQTGSKIIIKK